MLRDILLVTIAVAISICSMILKDHFYPPHPKFATVDIMKLKNEHIVAIGKKDVSQDEMRSEAERYTVRLKSSVKRLGEQTGYILIPKQAILSDAPEFTSKVKELLNQEENSN